MALINTFFLQNSVCEAKNTTFMLKFSKLVLWIRITYIDLYSKSRKQICGRL